METVEDAGIHYARRVGSLRSTLGTIQRITSDPKEGATEATVKRIFNLATSALDRDNAKEKERKAYFA